MLHYDRGGSDCGGVDIMRSNHSVFRLFLLLICMPLRSVLPPHKIVLLNLLPKKTTSSRRRVSPNLRDGWCLPHTPILRRVPQR